MSHFRPEESLIDNVILYNITGDQEEGDENYYSDSSEDENPMVRYQSSYTNSGKKKRESSLVRRLKEIRDSKVENDN